MSYDNVIESASPDVVADCYNIYFRANRVEFDDLFTEAIPRYELFSRLAEEIGNTSLREHTTPFGTVLAKEEFRNLSGSHYDRAYLPTIMHLERKGLIRPSDELRDISSGSAGISLAVLGDALGYKVRLVLPTDVIETPNRLYPMLHFGAEIVQADAEGKAYIEAASEHQRREIMALNDDPAWTRIVPRPPDLSTRSLIFEHREGNRICFLNHSENRLTANAFSMIGRELVIQLVEPPTAVLLAIGNWTTIAGITPVVREAWPETRIIGYQGENREIQTGQRQLYENFGTSSEDAAGTSVPMRFRNPELLDEVLSINDEDRDAMQLLVNSPLPEDARVGHTSLMAFAAVEQLGGSDTDRLVTLAYDRDIRY